MHQDIQTYRRQGFGQTLGVPDAPALVIVDFMNGFADPAFAGGGNIKDAVTRTVPVLAEARRRGWPIAHVRTVYAEDGSDGNVFTTKVPPLLQLTEHSALSAFVPELQPRAGEVVIRKTYPSALHETPLRSWLTRRRVDGLVVTGCTTSGCVRASVLDAMHAGFRPYVIRECVGDRSLAAHEANLFDMDQKCADVVVFDDFLRRLEEASCG